MAMLRRKKAEVEDAKSELLKTKDQLEEKIRWD